MANSALSSLLPLIILFFIIVIGAGVGFVIYSIATEVADKTSQKMEKHNLKFSKDGLTVGVRGRTTEHLEDKTQGFLMKVWNASAWPAYKSRLGWGQAEATGASPASTPKQEQRNPYSRTLSSQSAKKRRSDQPTLERTESANSTSATRDSTGSFGRVASHEKRY